MTPLHSHTSTDSDVVSQSAGALVGDGGSASNDVASDSTYGA